MQAMECLADLDIREMLCSTARRCGVDLDRLPKGEVISFPRPLRGHYDLPAEKLRAYNWELAEVEAAQEQCSKCDGSSCKHKGEWQKVAVYADIQGESVSLRFNHCRYMRKQYGEQRLKSLTDSAQIPVNYRKDTWDDFAIKEGNIRAVTLAKRAAFEDRSLYLWGECGTGKTKLTSIIANERIKKGLPVLFVSVPELYRSIKENFDKAGSDSELLRTIKRKECLILDDMGATTSTEWSVGIMQEIIDYRYANALQTIVTSNHSLHELSSSLVVRNRQGKVVEEKQASRISSRLEEMCCGARLNTPSFRCKHKEVG